MDRQQWSWVKKIKGKSESYNIKVNSLLKVNIYIFYFHKKKCKTDFCRSFSKREMKIYVNAQRIEYMQIWKYVFTLYPKRHKSIEHIYVFQDGIKIKIIYNREYKMVEVYWTSLNFFEPTLCYQRIGAFGEVEAPWICIQ